MSTESIVLLHPRPYARLAGTLVLVPLLQHKKPFQVPFEIWDAVFTVIFEESGKSGEQLWSLLLVCKSFTEAALPRLYARIKLSKLKSFEALHRTVNLSDQTSSLGRIKYSIPGRWIQHLDLEKITFNSERESLLFDSLLASIFSLVPFLSSLTLNDSFVLSRRAWKALVERPGVENICVLKGIKHIPSSWYSEEDPLIQLLRVSRNMTQLEVVCEFDPTLSDLNSLTRLPGSFTPLVLEHLKILSLLSMPFSPLLSSLLLSPLPALQKLTITPYDDVSGSLVSQFIETHGQGLRSLQLFTPKSWPTILHSSPTTLLQTSPSLSHLSLENPLPTLMTSFQTHPLQILSIPRPNAEFLHTLERQLSLLPQLRAVRMRDLRWCRSGLATCAQLTGSQGEMREWRRRLIRRGIAVIDTYWNELSD